MPRASFLNVLPRYEQMFDAPTLDEDTEQKLDEVNPSHDRVLRYSVLGILIIMVTTALYLTRVIALPVTAGIIFGLVLGPIVDRLVRRGVPQHLAAGLIVLAALIVLLGLLTILTVPIAAWSDQIPAMMDVLRSRLETVNRFITKLQASVGPLSEGEGMKVSVSEGNPLLGLAVSSTAAAGGVLITVATVYFYLATRRHVKARILRICLGRSVRKSAGAFFEDIEARVATYLGLVTAINLAVGILTALITWLAGLPVPIVWGALAFLLNYIAFVGPIIVTALLVVAGLIASPNLLPALLPALAYFGVHLIEGNVVTPVMVGTRLTVSPFLVFLSFIFWLWLWGPVGAILSTPLLLVAMVIRETLAREAIRRHEMGLAGT